MAAVVAVLDQLAKGLIVGWLGPDAGSRRWELAGNLLALEYVENTGAAFGILAGRPWLLSLAASLVAVAFIAIFRTELHHHGLMRVATGMVLGGAIGNLSDRVRHGYVVDYIAVGIWPKFNFADMAIVGGLALLAMMMRGHDTPEHDT